MPSSRSRSCAAALVLLAVLAGASGCGEAQEQQRPAKPFNDADVEFVATAGPHLTVTVTTARTAEDRARDADVRLLAEEVAVSQGKHADAVSAWVSEWGEQGAPFSHGDEDRFTHEVTAGFTVETVATLSSSSKARFDRFYLSSLLEHLEAGRTIWRSEAANGRDEEARDLAEQILAEQEDLSRAAAGLLRR